MSAIAENIKMIAECSKKLIELCEKLGMVEEEKTKYPKSYDECRDYIESCHIEPFCADLVATGYKSKLIESFARLLICRDAYWKLYGEEMELGKPWEPLERSENVYAIVCTIQGEAIKQNYLLTQYNYALTFPTEEMRDAFYENFKELIEQCKELL